MKPTKKNEPRLVFSSLVLTYKMYGVKLFGIKLFEFKLIPGGESHDGAERL